MPNITVEILEGRSLAQRKAFALAVTRACREHLGAPPERVRIRFLEVGEHEVMVDGEFAAPYQPEPRDRDTRSDGPQQRSEGRAG